MNEPSKVYQKGERVGRRGLPRKRNPYSHMSLAYDEWNRGWLAGMDVFLNGEKRSRSDSMNHRSVL